MASTFTRHAAFCHAASCTDAKIFSRATTCNSRVQSMVQRTRRIRHFAVGGTTSVPLKNCAQCRSCAGLPPARFNATSRVRTGPAKPKTRAARDPRRHPEDRPDMRLSRFLLPVTPSASPIGRGHAGGGPMSKRALTVTREQDFPEWYQAAVRDGDMAETSPVRGCMVIKPWGWGVWERIQAELDTPHQGNGPRELLFPAVHPDELHRQGGRARRRLRQGDGGRHPPPPEER